jgi:hypothetical protein
MSAQLPVLYRPGLSASDLDALRAAVDALEGRSFAARLAALAGRQIGVMGRPLSPQFQNAIGGAARAALMVALDVALGSLERAPGRDNARLHHRLAALSGGVGGALGLSTLPIELPVSTTIMLRAIGDIARAEGENLRAPETRIACLEVFALGGHGGDTLIEGGYLAIRGLLAKSVSDAARHVAARGAAAQGAPALMQLIGQISSRFGFAVSQKMAAQAVPIIGAISGAAINHAFTDHFQTLARGHFAMRRLERIHDPVMVRAEYARIALEGGYWAPPAG